MAAPTSPPTAPLATRCRLAWRSLLGTVDFQGPGGSLYAGLFPTRGAPPERNTHEFLQAYSTMPWLRAVTHRIASATSATRWHLYAAKSRQGRYVRALDLQQAPATARTKALKAGVKRQQIEEITDHPFLSFLHQGNPLLGGINTRRLLQIYLDIVGECYWVLQRNPAGMPLMPWPLPPSWVKTLPTPHHRVYSVEYQGWRGDIAEEDVVVFRDPNPAQPYGRGRGTAQSLADELETDEYCAKFVKTWFFNDAKPPIVVTADGLTQDETARLEEDWGRKNQGFWKRWKPYFMSRKVDIKELSQTFDNMQMVPLRAAERDIIIHTGGIPPELLGILTNSNRATSAVADYHFARYVTLPRLEYQRETLQFRVIPEFDERLIVDYETPVQEDNEHTLNVAKAAPWALDLDEWRAMAGQEPLADGQGNRVFAVPTNVVLMRLEDALATGAPSLTPDQLPARAVTRQPVRTGTKTLEDDLAVLQRLAGQLAPAVREQFLAMVAQLKGRLDLTTLHAAAATGDVAQVLAVIPWQTLPPALQGMEPILLQALGAAGTQAAADLSVALEIQVSFDLAAATAIAAARSQAGALVTNVTDATRDAIRQLVERALEDGIGPGALAQQVIDRIGLTVQQEQAVARFEAELHALGVDPAVIAQRVTRYREAQLQLRAETIARTELMTALNQGILEGWRQAVAGGLLNPAQWDKIWVLTNDDRLCLIYCEGIDTADANKGLGIESMFTLANGAHVIAPPAHPLCRCTMGLRWKAAA